MAAKNSEPENEEFSVILGTRKSGSRRNPKPSDVPEKVKEEPKDVFRPEKKKRTLSELIEKKEELEIFLNSIDEAHKNSKFPVYSYEKLREKAESELSKIKDCIKKRAYSDVKKEAEDVNADIKELHKSIASMKDRKVIKSDYEPADDPKNVSIEKLEKEIFGLSGRLESMYKKLNRKIEDVSMEDDVKMTENISRIMEEIKSIKASLSGFVKKAEMNNITLRTPVSMKHMGGLDAIRIQKPIPKHVVSLKNIAHHKGKDVMLECTITPFRFLKKNRTEIYWYKITDSSGKSILTSYKKIKTKKAKILGSVRKTRDGSLYVLFRELL